MPPDVSPLTIRTSVSEEGDYQSNPLLTPQGGRATYGSVTTPQVDLIANTATTSIDLMALMNANVYNLARFSSEDGHATLSVVNRGAIWTEKLGGSFDYDTTRTSEETSSGLEVAGVRHGAASIAPEVDYLLSPADELSIAASYSGAKYSNTQLFTDYVVATVSPGYTRLFDADNKASFNAIGRRYETRSGFGVQFTDLGGSVEWNSQLDQRWLLDVALGELHRSSHYDPIGGIPISGASVWDTTYSVSAGYTGLVDNFTISASRAPTPLSIRTEAVISKFTLSGSHFVTTRLELDLAATYQFANFDGTEGPYVYLQKNYLSVAPKVQYHVTNTLSFAVNGNFRRQQAEGIGNGAVSVYDPAQSSGVMFTVSYVPNPKDM